MQKDYSEYVPSKYEQQNAHWHLLNFCSHSFILPYWSVELVCLSRSFLRTGYAPQFLQGTFLRLYNQNFWLCRFSKDCTKFRSRTWQKRREPLHSARSLTRLTFMKISFDYCFISHSSLCGLRGSNPHLHGSALLCSRLTLPTFSRIEFAPHYQAEFRGQLSEIFCSSQRLNKTPDKNAPAHVWDCNS